MSFQRNLDHYPDVRNVSEYGFDFAFRIQTFFGIPMDYPEYVNAKVQQLTFKRVNVNGSMVLQLDEIKFLETEPCGLNGL